MINALCYKTKTPVYYNKGTKWEKTEDTFLFTYASNNDEKAKAYADYLNKVKPATNEDGLKIDWEKIDYFFINKQEEF